MAGSWPTSPVTSSRPLTLRRARCSSADPAGRSDGRSLIRASLRFEDTHIDSRLTTLNLSANRHRERSGVSDEATVSARDCWVSVVRQWLEALACALAGHAELGADHAPGRPVAMRLKCGGLDTAVRFSTRGCCGSKFLQRVGSGDDVVGRCIKLVDDRFGLRVGEVSWVLGRLHRRSPSAGSLMERSLSPAGIAWIT